MSQTFFSKQDATEKRSRLLLLGTTKGSLTVWRKGTKDKLTYVALDYDQERDGIILNTYEKKFPLNETILCAFELRGMNFFSEVVFQESIGGYAFLQFANTLFKSERRTSYRLMTYPMYEVWAEFELAEAYEGGKVVDIKSRTSQTGIFKNFLKLVEHDESADKLRVRVQDISTTGMALHIGELEQEFFPKDMSYKKVNIRFEDEVIQIPEVKIVYVASTPSNDPNLKKFKLGIHFENIPTLLDDRIGKKINSLLRQNDFNKDFETFIK